MGTANSRPTVEELKISFHTHQKIKLSRVLFGHPQPQHLCSTKKVSSGAQTSEKMHQSCIQGTRVPIHFVIYCGQTYSIVASMPRSPLTHIIFVLHAEHDGESKRMEKQLNLPRIEGRQRAAMVGDIPFTSPRTRPTKQIRMSRIISSRNGRE